MWNCELMQAWFVNYGCLKYNFSNKLIDCTKQNWTKLNIDFY